jgi:hypothetical protein
MKNLYTAYRANRPREACWHPTSGDANIDRKPELELKAAQNPELSRSHAGEPFELQTWRRLSASVVNL